MSRKPLISLVAGAFALMGTAYTATASPMSASASFGVASFQSPIVLVHGGGGGGGGHGGGWGGGGSHAGMHSGNFGGHSQFRAQAFARSNFSRGRHSDHGHGHHRNRFFIVGYPYYDYDDGYYDDDYGNDCWWSGRYHRWVCSAY